MQNSSLWINGTWQQGQGDSFTSTNPANNEVLWQGAAASNMQVDQAVTAARLAYQHWYRKSFDERLQYCKSMQSLLEKNQHTLSLAIAHEMGKPLWEANTEVTTMINKIDVSIKAYQTRTGSSQQDLQSMQLHIQHKAHGVIAIFSPFNFPAHIAHGQIIPALLAGNTIVLKPSELTPHVAIYMMQLWQQTGIPDGILNLVQGGRDTGQALVQHNDINAIFFTGSYAVAKQIHQQLAGQLEKLLVFELGGNNPMIVGTISDLEAAAYTIIQSAYITSGQRCTCARRLFIPQGKQGDDLMTQLIQMIQGIRCSHSEDEPQPFMGPVVSTAAATRIMQFQNHLAQQGAHILVAAKQADSKLPFITPALIDVSALSTKMDEECFGPLLQLQRYDTLDTAVTLANQTCYGLSSGILSDDRKQFDYYLSHSQAGLVHWNRPLSGNHSAAPFGGIKCSGNYHPAGFYMADACAYPVSSLISDHLTLPENITPGIEVTHV